MYETENYLKIGFFIGIGLLIGFLFWHPVNNNYVSQSEYDKLYNEYQKSITENEKLRENMANLLGEFYAKNLLSDILGLKKYRTVFCATQDYLKTEVPGIGELIC